MKKVPVVKKSLFYLFVLSLASCSSYQNKTSTEKAVQNNMLFFDQEVKPDLAKPCFAGAYYHKLVSSNDYWLGISGTVVLPKLIFDEHRENPKKPGQYLDNPSIYLGGRMGGQETDIGLSWEIIKYDNGQVSGEKKAFRPFLRRTAHASGQKAVFENEPAIKDYYWYPGEEVHLSLKIIGDKKLRFTAEGAGKKFERDFECDGYHFKAIGEFKRVNAIDQVANEGKPVKPTRTKIEGAVWTKTDLYRMVGTKVIKVPMHSGRYTEMSCPSAANFLVKRTEEGKKIGAEEVSISGMPY